MANFNAAFKTAQLEKAYKRNVNPSYRDIHGALRIARIPYTFAGTEATTDTITLGALGVPGAKVIPELSRIRDTGGAQDLDVSMKLSANIDGVATDLSGVVAFDNASIAFTEIAGADLIELDAYDDLTLTISDGTIGAVTAGETIMVEIAYVAPNAL